MKDIGLEFLPNTAGEAEGLNDAGIATFKDKPFAAVARETGQNSRDARDNSDAPVKLTFDLFTVPSSQFPSLGDYRSAIEICLAKASKGKNEKDIGFFKQALKALAAPDIRIMRIADFNTLGVRGPCVEGKPFHTLTKADGVSVKSDVASGGSFGIGKSAVSALSDIQTVFFSTRYADDDGDHVLCMGKTQLISHTGSDGEEKRRKGYWGKVAGFMPLEDAKDIPAWLLRDEQGTSIYSVCPRENRADWRYEMAATILINFFAAIQRKEMEFEIDKGFLKINRGTIEELFANPDINKAVGQMKARALFDAARLLHTCIIDDQATICTLEIPDLGKINLRVLLRDGLGYTIGVIRNGMYITDNLANFGEPFKRWPLHREFAVVIEPAGVHESEWFKRLENPSHNDLSAEQINDPALRERGQKAFELLAGEIRRLIRNLAKSEPASSTELDELNDFFASDETRTEDDAGETDPRALKPTTVKAAPRKPRRKVNQPKGVDEDVDGPFPNPDPNPDPPNPDPVPPGPTPRRRKVSEPIDLQNERNLLPEGANARKRRLFFTSPVKGDISVYVEATGLSIPDQIVITKAETGTIKDGQVVIPCDRGQRVSVDVEFELAYAGPIELSAFRLNEPEGEEKAA